MTETIRLQTSVERVAHAIEQLTYGEMLEAAGDIRDILSDRISDGEDISNSRTIADVLHSWAAAQFADERPQS